jgi:hypothetical protein
MQARTLTIVTILVDLKNAFLALLRENRKNPALLMMYAFIDIGRNRGQRTIVLTANEQ